MKNIQIFDSAENATFSIFQATEEEFAAIFPGPGQDVEFIEDLIDRIGDADAGKLLDAIWQRPILKRDAMGIHGSLFYEFQDRKEHYPATKREVDWNVSAINSAQRTLFAKFK
jgi:hypothetical protein